MGSIGSTIHSINASLLSEISAYRNSQTSGSTNSPSTSTPAPDSVNFSQSAQLFQDLQQLQTSNPAEFKQILSDAAAKFSAAASQQTNPTAANLLNNLASQFQAAASTGNLSALQPGAALGHHGHHHHSGSSISTNGPTASSTTNATTTSQGTGIQNLITSLLSSTGSSSQTGTQIQQALASLFT